MTAPEVELLAVRLRVTGVVQGVGFRPFVHRLATRHHLAGWVRNESGAVLISIEGGAPDLDGFLQALRREAPPLARIDGIAESFSEIEGLHGFAIAASAEDASARQPVPPDVGMCPACERELRDPGNRRYRYPFITCTDCGPRFTVVEGLPYDRERTTMRAFAQCPACLLEYLTPEDRRHHSETNSCPQCGPTLWFEASGSVAVDRGPDVLSRAVRLIEAGGVLALRGFGGFHLACDATDESAVQELRRRKQRETKPLAVMVASLAVAAEIAEVTEAESVLLQARERPIVLLPL